MRLAGAGRTTDYIMAGRGVNSYYFDGKHFKLFIESLADGDKNTRTRTAMIMRNAGFQRTLLRKEIAKRVMTFYM